MKFYKKHKEVFDYLTGMIVCLLVYLIPIILISSANAANTPIEGRDFGYALGTLFVMTGSFVMIPFSFISGSFWMDKGPARAMTFIIVSFLIYFAAIYMLTSSCYNAFNFYG